MVRRLRQADPDTPYVLMGYYNPIYRYGAEAFARDAVAAGVDGAIVVDLPPEEDAELAEPARAAGLDIVRLATPTSDEARLPAVVAHASGFLYYVAITGITGTRAADAASVRVAVERLRVRSPRPIDALLELVAERQPGLLVFGPDRSRLSTRRYRKAAKAVREQASCLVWLAEP